jgi:hypothetical protein
MTSPWLAVLWLPTYFSTTSRPDIRDGDVRLVFMSRLHELYGHPEVPMERVQLCNVRDDDGTSLVA